MVVNWLIFEGIPGQNGAQAFLTGSPRIAQNPQAVANLCALWQCHASRTDQFVSYIHNMLTFQFGDSYQNGQPISIQVITQGRLQNTLLLLGVSTILGIVIGAVLGIVSASRRSSILDKLNVSVRSRPLPFRRSGLVCYSSSSSPWVWAGFPQAAFSQRHGLSQAISQTFSPRSSFVYSSSSSPRSR